MRPLAILTLIGFAVFLAGCSTPVKSEYKPGVNFSQYKTFALQPFEAQAPAEDPGLMMRVSEPARQTVASELTAKGLNPEAQDKADLAINLRGQSFPRVEVKNYGYSYPVMTRAGMVTVVENPYSTVSTYNERTLLIEMLDTKTKEAVWIGWLKKESSKKVTPEAMEKAVRAILAQYPPQPKK